MTLRNLRPLLFLLAFSTFAVPAFAQEDCCAKAEVYSRLLGSRDRLVFDWDSREKVPFSLQQNGNRIVLHFEKPVRLKWGDALEPLAPYVQGKSQPDNKTVIITLRHPMRARHLAIESKDDDDVGRSGIEFTAQKNTRPIPTLDIASELQNEQAPPPPKHTVAALKKNRQVAQKQKPARKILAHSAPVERKKYAVAHDEDVKLLARLSPASGKPPASSVSATTAAPPPPAPTAEAAAPAVQLPVVAAPAPAAPSALKATPAFALPAAIPQEALAASENKVMAEIVLPVKITEPLAVFVKNNSLWIAADPSSRLTAESLNKDNPDLAHPFRKVPGNSAAIFTTELGGSYHAFMRHTTQGGLHIVLQTGKAPPAELLTPVAHPSSSPNRLPTVTIAAATGNHVIKASDPATGEEMSLIPLPVIGAGVLSHYSFVQFNVLPSAQGIAIIEKADMLSVAVRQGEVTIGTPHGLIISSDAASDAQDVQYGDSEARATTLFPYARWKLDDEKNFGAVQRKLFRTIAYSVSQDPNKSRMKLIGLFLSEGLFPEALGAADNILRTSYKFYHDNNVAALRGAAYFFMYRIREAEQDFASPELQGNPEAAMWLSLCKELLGESTPPFDFLGNYEAFIRNYPPVFIQKLSVIAADRAISRKDYATAKSIFSLMKRDALDEPVKKYLDYMQAQVFYETGDTADAQTIWEAQAQEVDDPLLRARAEFSLINMELSQNKITPEEAEKRLDKLRAVWRGDSLEINVLSLLGNLYIANKQYDKALFALRDIVLYYPQLPEALTTAKQMEQIFITLYNKGGADAMQPLDALALFYEFRDLVPSGKEGDQMIRNLADRLVSLDLLDRAALLLSHQVQKRLQGEERSRVGTRLALVYLMNHQPKEALETLRTTGYGELPVDLQQERLRMTAQALAQQGQVQRAIDVISNDNSTDGLLLRLSIYWDNKDWANVVAIAEEYLSNRSDPSAPLNPQESDVLLQLATAYVYEHDSGQIQYLRDYFTPLLNHNPAKDSFLFITSESGVLDYENMSSLDQDITSVKSYLDHYRENVKKSGLSNTL